MAPDLGERARRRQDKRRRQLIAAGSALGAVLIVAVIGAFALGGGDGEKPANAERSVSTSISSSTSSTSTTTTIVPRSTNPVVALAQQYDGAYQGTFQNTTYHTTGPVTLELRIDPNAGTLDVRSTLDGDVFGGGAAQVRTIRGRVKLADPNASVSTQTKAFGAVTARIDASLRLTLTAADVPDPKVKGFELVGGLRADKAGFDGTYTVTFEDGRTAQGTITVTCSATGQRPSEVSTLCSPPT